MRPKGARTKRAEREMDAEARSNAVVLPEDDLSDSGAWRNMKQDSLPLKEQPIKGAEPENHVDSTPLISTHAQEEPVAAAPAVVAIKPLTEVREKELQQKFAAQAGELQTRVAALVEKRKKASGIISPFMLAEAQELKELGTKHRAELAESEWRQDATTFHRWHSRLTQLLGFLSKPADDADKLFSDFAFSRKQQVEQAARAERLRLEQIQAAKDQADRDAEIARLKAEERHEEAQIVADTPLPPPVAPAAKPAAPIAAGVSVVVSVKLARIADVGKLVAFLVKNPMLLLQLFEIKEGAWKQFLTNHYDKKSGEMTLDAADIGIEIEVSGSGRNRKSNGEV